MNDELLRQALHDLADDEIGEDMNLLPEILARVEPVAALPARHLWRGGRLAALVAAALIATTAVFAMVARQLGDPGLDAAREANLVTDLNLSQTIDGVTVTLNWAYADAHRIAVGYSIEAPEGEDAFAFNSQVALSDTDNSFTLDGGWGGGGSGVTGAPADFMTSVGARFAADTPAELNMTAAITLGRQEEMTPDNSISGELGGGGGGGGGGGEPLPGVNGIIVPPGIDLSDPIGPFTFEFELPFIPEIPIVVNQSVEASDLTMRLETLGVTPSMTVARLCMEMPLPPSDWLPDVQVTMNEQTVGAQGLSMVNLPTPEDIERCWDASIPAPYKLEPTDLTLTVPRLRIFPIITQERVDQFVSSLAAQGVTVEVEYNSESMNYSVTGGPDGVDVGALVTAAYDEAFSESILGPWSVTVSVPGANP